MSVAVNQSKTFSTSAHLMAGWPLILVIFGGVIGGLLGLIAYVINRKIYASEQLQKYNKVLANLLCGMSAISLWWFCSQWLQASF